MMKPRKTMPFNKRREKKFFFKLGFCEGIESTGEQDT